MTSVEDVTPKEDITTTTERKNKMKKPKIADFGAPVNVKSVYFHFCNTHRADVTQKVKEEAVKNGAKFSIEAVGKALGQMWKAITEEEKTRVTDEFNRLKTEGAPAAEEWKNSEGYKKFLQSKSEYSKKVGTKKAKAKLLEEGCPKKPLNTYMIYNMQTRNEVKKEWEAAGKTGVSNKEYAAEISRRWKLLAPEEKAKFSEQSRTQQAEYKEKMIEYQKTDSYRAYEEQVGKLNDRLKAAKKVVKTGVKIAKEGEEEEEGGEEGEEKDSNTGSEEKKEGKTRKRPAKEAVDAEGNPIEKKPKRAKKEPELDADGNVIEKRSRKPKPQELDAEGNVIEKPKRGKKEPEVDADGNVVEKKKRARSPKEKEAPALDEDGNPIKKAMKARTKKNATEPVAAPDSAATEETSVAAEEDGKPTEPTVEAGDEDEEEVEEAQEE